MGLIRTRAVSASVAALEAGRRLLRCLDMRRPPDPALVEVLAVRLEQRVLEPGRTLFTAGRNPAGVWMVRSGSLELSSGSGRDRVVVAVLGPCGVAGDIPLLTARPAVCTVRTVTDLQALFLAAPAFTGLLETEPVFARTWLTGVASRQAHAQDTIAGTVGGSAAGRLARLLLREANGGVVSCSQGTLAAMAGLRRPTVNQILKEFERDGLLSVGYREVKVVSAEGLSRRAEGVLGDLLG